MSECPPRHLAARLGIATLNFLAPGLGLLRLQKLKAAVAFLLAPAVILLLVTLIYAAVPDMGFRGWAALMAALLAAAVALYIAPIAIGWRASRLVQSPGPWWSHWYGIVFAFAVVLAIGWALPDVARSYYRVFYVPSEAMMPTLRVNDRFVASMRGSGELHRGDIILLAMDDTMYVKRVAALPGDHIEIRDGIVVLNGAPVVQRFSRIDRVESGAFGDEARRLSEQFPGEAAAHEIYDLGYSQGDDFPEQRIAPGHVFVLGDNRDMSADSRFPRSVMGVAQLPIADIRGRALFYLWGPSGRLGETLAR